MAFDIVSISILPEYHPVTLLCSGPQSLVHHFDKVIYGIHLDILEEVILNFQNLKWLPAESYHLLRAEDTTRIYSALSPVERPVQGMIAFSQPRDGDWRKICSKSVMPVGLGSGLFVSGRNRKSIELSVGFWVFTFDCSFWLWAIGQYSSLLALACWSSLGRQSHHQEKNLTSQERS